MQLFGGAKGSNILSHCVVKLAMLVAIVSVDKYQRGQAPSAVTDMEQDIRSLLPATALALQPITGQRMNAAETLTLLRERFVPSLVEYIRSRDVQMNNYDPDDWETPFDEGLNFLHAGAASFNDPALTASLLQSPPLQELVRGLGYVIPTDDHARDQELGNAAARIHCSLYSLWRPLAQRLQDDELYPAVNFNLPPCQWLIDSQRELQFEQIARALATLSDSDGLLAGFVSHASQQSLATHLVYNVYCNSLLASLTEAYLGTSTQKSFHEHVRRLSSVHCGGPVSPGLFLDTDTARLGRVALAEVFVSIVYLFSLHAAITPHTFSVSYTRACPGDLGYSPYGSSIRHSGEARAAGIRRIFLSLTGQSLLGAGVAVPRCTHILWAFNVAGAAEGSPRGCQRPCGVSAPRACHPAGGQPCSRQKIPALDDARTRVAVQAERNGCR